MLMVEERTGDEDKDRTSGDWTSPYRSHPYHGMLGGRNMNTNLDPTQVVTSLTVCPTCGTCPTCGRANHVPIVPYLIPVPSPYLPQVTWIAT